MKNDRKIMRYDIDEFEPIRTQLRIVLERHIAGGTHYVKTMVADAQRVRRDPNGASTIERATYRYSVTLGRSNAAFLDGMRADQLTVDDIKALLSFFESI